jgi:hypothetical protein
VNIELRGTVKEIAVCVATMFPITAKQGIVYCSNFLCWEIETWRSVTQWIEKLVSEVLVYCGRSGKKKLLGTEVSADRESVSNNLYERLRTGYSSLQKLNVHYAQFKSTHFVSGVSIQKICIDFVVRRGPSAHRLANVHPT